MTKITSMDIEKVPLTYSANGYSYKIIRKDKDAAIYAQSKDGVVQGFEVVKLQWQPAWEAHGAITEAHYAVPSNEAFGKTGWFFRDLEQAEVKMNELIINAI